MRFEALREQSQGPLEVKKGFLDGRPSGLIQNLLVPGVAGEREEGDAWVRIEAPVAPTAETASTETGIPPRGTATLSVSRVLPPDPGRYRVDVAVIDGEEVRASYVIDLEAADTPPSS